MDKIRKDANSPQPSFDDTLRRMLSTPHDPHKPPKAKKPKASAKKPA
jgi:hypothetical protein